MLIFLIILLLYKIHNAYIRIIFTMTNLTNFVPDLLKYDSNF